MEGLAAVQAELGLGPVFSPQIHSSCHQPIEVPSDSDSSVLLDMNPSAPHCSHLSNEGPTDFSCKGPNGNMLDFAMVSVTASAFAITLYQWKSHP